MKRFGSTIALAFEGDALPTEFRLFVKGWNFTENGKFLFDDVAAKSVMASYAAWGIDLAIDLEHQMLADGAAADPTARDARGWCKLEVRAGELWACDVRWTADGAARLTNKTQRYVSPAFDADPKSRRVLKMINVAITALPATHKTPALVAASATGESSMDPKMVQKALEAIQNGDDAAAVEILKGMIVSAAAGEPAPDDVDPDGSEGDGAEGVEPAPAAESVEKPKQVDMSVGAPPGKGDGKGDSDDEDDDAPAKKANRKVLRAALCRATGKDTFAEAVAEVEVFRKSHIELETERTKLAAERAALEGAERRRIVVELVKLGAEFPSTVWADAESKTIKPRWLKMPIAELRSHVVEQRAARGVKPASPGVKPPKAGESAAVVELSDSEKVICAELNCDPADFVRLRASRDGKGN